MDSFINLPLLEASYWGIPVATAASLPPSDINGTVRLALDTNQAYRWNGSSWVPVFGSTATGTVTSVSVTTANGVSGTVATATTTPAISLVLGAITPTSVAASGSISGSNLSGTNTGDQTSVTGNAGTATALQTPRAINGVNFDGTAAITVTAAAGTLTGTTLAAAVVSSSLTSVGTLTGGATGAGFTVALSSSTITGTLADARLSANVPLLNAANAFAGLNTFVTGQVFSGTTIFRQTGGSANTNEIQIFNDGSNCHLKGLQGNTKIWANGGLCLSVSTSAIFFDVPNFQATNNNWGMSSTGFQFSSGHKVTWAASSSNAFTPDTTLARSANGGVLVGTIAGTGTKDPALTVTPGAHTALTASTEYTDLNFNLARTIQFATGALATQRSVRIQAPTLAAVAASTITTAATVDISGAPIAGTNATITNGIAARIAAGYSGARALQLIMGGASSSNSVFEILKSDGTTIALRFKDNLAFEIPTGGLVATDLITDGSGNRVKLNLNNGVAGTLRQHNAVTALGGSIYQMAGLSSTSTERVQAEIRSSWSTSTDATRQASMVLGAYGIISSVETFQTGLTITAQSNGVPLAAFIGPVKTESTTVASLQAAATAGAGARSFVTDATLTVFLSTVVGGGGNKVPVVSDGTNWLIG